MVLLSHLHMSFPLVRFRWFYVLVLAYIVAITIMKLAIWCPIEILPSNLEAFFYVNAHEEVVVQIGRKAIHSRFILMIKSGESIFPFQYLECSDKCRGAEYPVPVFPLKSYINTRQMSMETIDEERFERSLSRVIRVPMIYNRDCRLMFSI